MKTKLSRLTLAVGATVVAIASSTFAGEPALPGSSKIGTPGRLYSCPMHRQIRWSRADLCPICGMKLVAVKVQNQMPTEQAVQPRAETPADHETLAMPSHAGMQMDRASMNHGMGGCGMCMEMMRMGKMNNRPRATPRGAAQRGYGRGMRGGGCGC